MLPGSGRPHIPLSWEAGNRKGSATSELCDLGWSGYLTSLDCSVLIHIMDIAVPLHVMRRIKQNECESKNRGWESRTGRWQGLAAPMGTSENGEGFYQCLGSGCGGSQARLLGSQHRHTTTEGPSANKQTNKTPSCQVLLPMSFGANQEKNIWFSE